MAEDLNATEFDALGRCVASCPRCARQYKVRLEDDGKQARCRPCGTSFTVGLSREVLSPTDEIILKTPVALEVSATRHAAELMVQKMFQAFRLAGVIPTRSYAMQFIASIPRRAEDLTDPMFRARACLSTIESIYTSDNAEADEIARYFIFDVPGLNPDARDLIEAAIIGTFCGLSHAPTLSW